MKRSHLTFRQCMEITKVKMYLRKEEWFNTLTPEQKEVVIWNAETLFISFSTHTQII